MNWCLLGLTRVRPQNGEYVLLIFFLIIIFVETTLPTTLRKHHLLIKTVESIQYGQEIEHEIL